MTSTVVLRPALPEEATDVRRLAYLDTQRPLRGDVIVAEVDGTLVAAVSPRDGRLVADPFVWTADVAELLREHVRGLRSTGRARHRPRRTPRPRLGFAT